MKVFSKAEKQESGSQRCRESLYGRTLTYDEVLQYGSRYKELHREWSLYKYDKTIAVSTLEHGTGYLNPDIIEICGRTINTCNIEQDKIEREIDLIEEGCNE